MSFNAHSFAKHKRDRNPTRISGQISGKISAKNSLRKPTHYLLGAALSVGLMATSLSPSEAAMVKLGNVDVQIDTTVSYGMTWAQKDADSKFLPEVNGGPAEVNGRYDFFRSPDGSIRYYNHELRNEEGDLLIANPETREMPVASGGAYMGDSSALTGTTPTAVIAGGKTILNTARTARCSGNDYEYGGFCQNPLVPDDFNFDGSINTDDGRLNFDKGDPVSAPLKLVSEIEAQMGDFTAFTRIRAFHDVVLMDDDSFNRKGELTDDGEELAGQHIDILDAFVTYDGYAGDMPFTIRAGKQVINWGEATFIPGGNSAFNPIDISALRRPGAEIKEALLPVEALYGSIALTDDISLEAYVGGWDDYKIDVGGTFFAASDVLQNGSTTGNGRVYHIGGGPFAGSQWVCDLGNYDAGNYSVHSGAASGQLAKALATAANDARGNPCDETENVDILRPWSRGNVENERLATDPDWLVKSFGERDGDEAMGLAVRWYAENLNSTEFAFYYQKADSRLPYISYRVNPASVGAGVVGRQADQVGRAAGIAGCAGSLAADVTELYALNYDIPENESAEARTRREAMRDAKKLSFVFKPYQSHTVRIADPDGLISALAGEIPGGSAGAFFVNTLRANGNNLAHRLADTEILNRIEAARARANPQAKPYLINNAAFRLLAAIPDGDDADSDNSAEVAAYMAEHYGDFEAVYATHGAAVAAYDALAANAGGDTVDWAARQTLLRSALVDQTPAEWNERGVGVDDPATTSVDETDGRVNTIANYQQVACALTLAQAATAGTLGTVTSGHPFDGLGQLPSGAVNLSYTPDMGLIKEYPEVETMGFSFNTVVAGWGVQGDFTFRPDAPLQLDTDVLTINSLFESCAAIGAGVLEAVYLGAENYNVEFNGTSPFGCTRTSKDLKGYVEHDVTTWDIGTTATFTRSNPVINFIGADLGVLLTEFQGMIADGIDDRAMPGAFGGAIGLTPLANRCTSGSDLPLSGLLQIDERPDGLCRPTETSSGMVLLANAQYNNVFGTPFALTPQIVYSEGLEGYSPAPLGSWREGVGRMALSLNASYLDSWRGSISYVTHHGDDLRTKDGDRDYLSASLSYAF